MHFALVFLVEDEGDTCSYSPITNCEEAQVTGRNPDNQSQPSITQSPDCKAREIQAQKHYGGTLLH